MDQLSNPTRRDLDLILADVPIIDTKNAVPMDGNLSQIVAMDGAHPRGVYRVTKS